MAKFLRIRELFDRYPRLAKWRHALLTYFSGRGTTWLDISFRRMKVIHPEAQALIDEGCPVIYALYHGDMAVLLDLHPRKHVVILVSNSRDGDMIAGAAHSMGFSTARGSSARGGVKGLLELIAATRQGLSPAMLVDGPKGPRHEIKGGVIKLAQKSGLPILPMVLSARSAWFTNSWDKYQAISWGSPTVSVYAQPLRVPENATDEELEALRLILDERMRGLHKWAELAWAFSDGKRVGGLIA